MIALPAKSFASQNLGGRDRIRLIACLSFLILKKPEVFSLAS